LQFKFRLPRFKKAGVGGCRKWLLP